MKKLLTTFAAFSLSNFVVNSTISCSIFNESAIDSLLNFREIDYNDVDNIPLVRTMQEDVLNFRGNYFKKIQTEFNKKYNEITKKLKKGQQINVDQKQNTKVGVKSELIDTVYLGQQPFGQYYPRATQLHEINRYEMPNFSALEKAGYTLYLNNSNNEGIEIMNIDKNKENYVDEEGKQYVPILNEFKTDCIYFKTTDIVDDKYANNSSTWSFVAKKDDEVLITKPNSYNNTTINVSIVDISTTSGLKDYAQYKMGDWLRYEFVNNINVQAYQLTTYLLIYIEAIGNYLQFLEKITVQPEAVEKADLINGMSRIIDGRFSSVTSAGSLYAAVKFGFNFDMFTIMQDDSETTVNFILDQNMGINVKFEEDILNTKFTKLHRDELNFNPYLLLNDKTISFARRIWEIHAKLYELQKTKLGELENDSSK